MQCETPFIVLTAARAVIAKPENWCQHSRLNNLGQRCALGAIDAVLGVSQGFHRTHDHPAIQALARCVEGGPTCHEWSYDENLRQACRIAVFNNNHSHADVLSLFDRAIAVEGAKLHETDISVFTALLDAPAVEAGAVKEGACP